MKKKIHLWSLLLFLLSLVQFVVTAQNTDLVPTNSVTLISSDITSSLVRFDIQDYQLQHVNTPRGIASVVRASHSTPILKAAAPDLPKMTTSVIISPTNGTNISVLTSDYTDYPNIDIAPSKGNLSRNQNPEDIPYTYSSVYAQDAFFPHDLVQLRQPYILRDYRAQTIVVQPFQYNPVTRTLRVYHHVTVRLDKNEAQGNNCLSHAALHHVKPTAEWNNIYANQFLNYNAVFDSRYEPISDTPAKLLVITHPDFANIIQEYVQWKIRKGIPTEVLDVTNIGNENAIKEVVRDRYENQQITHVLLVGDAQFVPSLYSSLAAGYSDVQYGCVAGVDSYPEVFVGRFSGETIAHIRTQVNRTLEYERNPNDLSDWYKKATFVGSDQGPGDDGEMDWEHERNMRNDFLAYGYNTAHELYDGSQGEADAPGNPAASAFINVLNEGMTAITYTGHGYAGGCSTTGLDMSQIPSLQNQHRLPFFWSVACVNGEFVDGTCFAEALLRSENNGEAVGCIATLMSTVNQSWNPPMDAQDEMVDILTEQYDDHRYKSFAGISYNGCMHMNDQYGSDGQAMTDSWTCFGDPSLLLRTDIPQNITANHAPTVFIGSNNFTVTANAEGAVVALVIDNQIIATATIVDGLAQLSFDPISNIGELLITISGYNYIPYLGSADIVPSNAPYIATIGNTFVDNNNHIAENGETAQWNINFKNLGLVVADNATAILSTNNPYISITDNAADIGTLQSNTELNLDNAFAFTIANNIPDQTQVSFLVSISDASGNTWQSYINLTVNAPELLANTVIIDDSFGGNNNGRLDAGETVTLTIPTQNVGHRTAESGSAILSSFSSNITFANNNLPIAALAINEQSPLVFGVVVSPTAMVGSSADFHYQANAGEYTTEYSFILPIGLIVEDFETADFEQFNWNNNSSQPWQIDSNVAFEGNESARSGNIGNNSETILEITRNVSINDSISFYKRVSSEQDWDFLHFYIDGIELGTWSGLVEWSREAYPLTAGEHTFRWAYTKDDYYTDNEDAVWIDFVQLPAESSSLCLAEAGNVQLPTTAIYQNQAFTINSTAYNPNLTQWYVVANPTAPHSIIAANTTGIFSLPLGNYWVYAVNSEPSGNPITTNMNIDDLSSQFNCIDISSPESIQLQVVGIVSSLTTNVGLTLSPIPATDLLQITIQSTTPLQSLSIYNSAGQCVWQQTLAQTLQQNLSIPVQTWSKGSYFVVLNNGNSNYSRSFVKQ